MSDKTPEELAREGMAPGKFNFTDRLRGRNYPKDDVVVYLDDAIGYKIAALEQEYQVALSPEVQEDIKAQIADLKVEAEPSKMTFHLQGISSKRYDELVDQVNELFPEEYEEEINLIGAKTRTLKDVPERNDLFTVLLWVEHIKGIQDADGNESEDEITPELVKELRETAPLSAVVRIGSTVEKLRVAVDWVGALEDPDFLARR